MVAQGDERVLEWCSRVRVRVDVARRDRGDAQLRGQLGQLPVACAVVAMERALQLDVELLGPEGGAQPLERGPVADAVARAPAQADEARGVLLQRLERDRGRRLVRVSRVWACARVRM